MQVGLEARSDAPSHTPERVREREPVPRRTHDRLRVAAVLPLFLVLAAFEIAWLLLLGSPQYQVMRFQKMAATIAQMSACWFM